METKSILFARRATLFFCLSVLLPATYLHSQTDDIRFEHITIEDGLSQSAVFAILQDSKGFMWFGTKDGLNKYDGYSFTIYEHDPFDSTTISHNYIKALFEDSGGHLWVGTLDGGLNRMNRQTETFQRFLHDPENPQSLSSNNVTAIVEDKHGNLWVGTADGGLNFLDRANLALAKPAFSHFTHDPNNPWSLDDDRILAMAVDQHGALWVGTQSGLNKWQGYPDNRFRRFQIKTRNPQAKPAPNENAVSAIYEDREGRLWLGTFSGVALCDRSSGQTTPFPNRYEIRDYGWGQVWDIAEDQSGSLWLATGRELMRFDPVSKTYSYYAADIMNPHSISLGGISKVFGDRNGNIWIGTNGFGINIYFRESSRFKTFHRERYPKQFESGFSVRALFEDAAGHVWIGADVLYRWNRKTGELINFRNPGDLTKLGSTSAWSIIQDRAGQLWFATYRGLYRYDPKTTKYIHFTCDPTDTTALQEEIVFGVFEDRDGGIWAITERHLSKLLDVESGRFRHYCFNDKALTNEPMSPSVHQDEQGRLWLATNAGLVRFDPAEEKFHYYRNDPRDEHSLSSNLVRTICPDPRAPESFLWIGTAGGGLNLMDIGKESFTQFTNAEGLPNNVVYAVLPDSEGNLWMSTNKGLSRFAPATGQFKNFDVNDGLQSNEFNTCAFHKNKNGELFFGGINGFNYFNPSEVIDDKNIPPLAITDLKLFNQSVAIKDAGSVLKHVISETDRLALSYRDNVISFEFAALDYYAPSRNQYAYKLEGFNDDWIDLGKRREVSFTNLDPGAYTLRIKGSNSDGVWNEQGVSLRIDIAPPLWKTWWAYSFYLIAVVAILFAARRYEMARLRLRARLDLEHAEAENLRRLDQMKSRFFANISHEFRTPLTLITGPIDRIMPEVSTEAAKSSLLMIRRNANRLLKLISQILDLSKLEAGKMQLHVRRFECIAFLRAVTAVYESQAKMKNVGLSILSKYEELPIFGDEEKLENILHNLISNALKFTPEGGKIEITLEVNEQAGSKNDHRTMLIGVRDTGAGIPEKSLGRIFERFYQVDDDGLNAYGGSGIGLALVKELTELHRGTIAVASEPGKGTIFTLTVPIDKDAYKESELVDSPDKAYRPEGTAIDAIKSATALGENSGSDVAADTEIKDEAGREIILFVEDNADVRAYLRGYFEKRYHWVEAKDGEAGVAKAREIIPDLVISDLMMPKMNGYAVCKALKTDERTSHIPVILLTARAAQEDKLEGLETGVDDYLIKPFDYRELLVRVNNLIQLRRTLRERFSQSMLLKPNEVSVTPLDQAFLEKVMQSIESHIADEAYDLPALCRELAMSERQLQRKLKAITNQTPNQFIRFLRLQRARDLLEQQAGTISDIAYMVGFSSVAYFTRCFREQFGKPPSELKNEEVI